MAKRDTAQTQDADAYVGSRLRERRLMLGLTQQQVAKMVGVTYQMTHKYERGTNRVSAGRLYELARALDVSVGYFFEGLDGLATDGTEVKDHERAAMQMMRGFHLLPDAQRAAISALVLSLVPNGG